MDKLIAHLRRVLGFSPVFRPTLIRDLSEYRALAGNSGDVWSIEKELVALHPTGAFTWPGHCWVDGAQVDFVVDYRYAHEEGGTLRPNWRERLECPRCGLNSRRRASLHIASHLLHSRRDARIYITEQSGPVYDRLKASYPEVIGSEFLGNDVAPGAVDPEGRRHEDLTRLSLSSGSVDAILTFDVLEHIPRHEVALAECFRALSDEGVLIFSVPFVESAQLTRTRARYIDGQLVHVDPPVYHGDPIRPDTGLLCFHEFGWDILDTLRSVGFADAAAIAYRSPSFGYLGGSPLLFAGWKSSMHRGDSAVGPRKPFPTGSRFGAS